MSATAACFARDERRLAERHEPHRDDRRRKISVIMFTAPGVPDPQRSLLPHRVCFTPLSRCRISAPCPRPSRRSTPRGGCSPEPELHELHYTRGGALGFRL